MTRVVERVLTLMECFDHERPSLPLHEIASRAKLPKPTVFRLLATLVQAGYVLQLGNQEYTLSHKLMRLASVAQRTFSIRDVARPIISELVEATGETVDLSILSGTHRVCIDVLESPQPLKSIVTPGETIALEAGASGKLLLAYNETQLLDAVLKASKRAVDKGALTEALALIRRNGYAHTRGERVEGVEAISVPLHDHTGAVNYSLTLTGPAFRFEKKSQRFVELMVASSAKISQILGAPRVKPEPAAKVEK